jgi:hypothetical protein
MPGLPPDTKFKSVQNLIDANKKVTLKPSLSSSSFAKLPGIQNVLNEEEFTSLKPKSAMNRSRSGSNRDADLTSMVYNLLCITN